MLGFVVEGGEETTGSQRRVGLFFLMPGRKGHGFSPGTAASRMRLANLTNHSIPTQPYRWGLLLSPQDRAQGLYRRVTKAARGFLIMSDRIRGNLVLSASSRIHLTS